MKTQRKADDALPSSRELFKKTPQSVRGSVSKKIDEKSEKLEKIVQDRRKQYLKGREGKTGCSTGRNSRRVSNANFDVDEAQMTSLEKRSSTNTVWPLQSGTNNGFNLTQGRVRTTSTERKSLKPRNVVSNKLNFIFLAPSNIDQNPVAMADCCETIGT
jgi:hypothetical protein